MLVVGVLVGLFNGIAVAVARIPPFMVTLVAGMFCAALAIFLVKSENIINLPTDFTRIGGFSRPRHRRHGHHGDAGGRGAPRPARRTMFGRWLYAIGTNPRAAVVSGVPVRRVTVATYMFSGFCAAVASVIYSSRMGMGRPTLGDPLLLDIIGGAVIGGTSLAGGKGKILWTFFGVMFLSLLGNALSLLNVPFFYIEIVKGGVILFAALVDVMRRRISLRGA